AMTARIKGDRVIAGIAQRAAGALPGVASLAAAMQQDDEPPLRIAPTVARDRYAAGAVPDMHRHRRPRQSLARTHRCSVSRFHDVFGFRRGTLCPDSAFANASP